MQVAYDVMKVCITTLSQGVDSSSFSQLDALLEAAGVELQNAMIAPMSSQLELQVCWRECIERLLLTKHNIDISGDSLDMLVVDKMLARLDFPVRMAVTRLPDQDRDFAKLDAERITAAVHSSFGIPVRSEVFTIDGELPYDSYTNSAWVVTSFTGWCRVHAAVSDINGSRLLIPPDPDADGRSDWHHAIISKHQRFLPCPVSWLRLRGLLFTMLLLVRIFPSGTVRALTSSCEPLREL